MSFGDSSLFIMILRSSYESKHVAIGFLSDNHIGLIIFLIFSLLQEFTSTTTTTLPPCAASRPDSEQQILQSNLVLSEYIAKTPVLNSTPPVL